MLIGRPWSTAKLPLLRAPLADPARPTRVVGVVNPIRPKAEWAAGELRTACEQAGWPEPSIVTTTIAEAGAEQAEQAVADGADLVVALGGDGTVREVARGLAHSGVPLGVVPLGTANLFARNLLLPPGNLRRAIRLALHGATAPVDLGRVSVRAHADTGDWLPEETFLVLAGMGHDAHTVLATSAHTKSRLGWLAYLGAGAQHLHRRPVRVRLQVDEQAAEDTEVWSVLVGNCGRIPGGIAVFPHALLDDGRLELMEARVRHPAQWLPVAWQGLRHRPVPGSGLVLGRARTVRVVPEQPHPVQLDGDVLPSVGEAVFSVDPGALLVRLDRPRARRTGRPTPFTTGTADA
ncbi:diacylglycerol/lipid kinase family protein [Enemella evansiae]|uniref:diacylglycerol/lipid kinase family protein n=1 Tax=Enemella evansiae TaxID=2016499 RepID=UPI00105FF49F|nr:diacylglycerol kinase family protein [Enemella evansiae]TDO93692.1 YegS/Rv2252/BmrU family lipid kinase [Enemella evansiae]